MAKMEILHCQRCGEENGLDRCSQCRQLRCTSCEDTTVCDHLDTIRPGAEVFLQGGQLVRRNPPQAGRREVASPP